ncbi:MAG: hypothetical protein E7473_08295 [Ruminococcaceae bacterium]|nr:hypothetical protein [Oscillospiraceae bacterium]
MKRIIAIFLCGIMLLSLFSVCYAEEIAEQKTAEDLKTLGLFKGVSETDFDLNRAPTRAEALVMLIRLLGEEKEALSHSGESSFVDVPDWAKAYVAYGFEKGYTKGISEEKFGSSDVASEEMYLTFVLRSLGYSDTEGDFSWDNPYELAKEAGILSEESEAEFTRGDVVIISKAALSALTEKGKGVTLGEKLISAGVFTRETYNKVMGIEEPEKEESENDPFSFIKPEGELFVEDLNLSIGTKSQKAMKLLTRFIETNADFYEWPYEYLVYRDKESEEETHYFLSHDREKGDIHAYFERFPEEGGSYVAKIVLEKNGKTFISCDYYESRRATTPARSASMYIDREDIYRGMGIELENFGGRPDEEREFKNKMRELIPEVAGFIDAIMQKNFAFYGCGSAEALGFEL